MAATVKYYYGTEVEILNIPVDSLNWTDRAFYYPSDKDYFYQAIDGVMKKYGGGGSAGVGIKLNDVVIGGIKRIIESGEILTIPENYDYNTYSLTVDGIINNDGQINI